MTGKCLVLLALVAVASATRMRPLMFHPINRELDSMWNEYKNVHGKSYAVQEEDVARRMIWEQNLKTIQQHNLEYDLGRHTYFLGMNQFGDLTVEEFLQTLFPMNISARASDAPKFLPPSNIGDLPDTVDWRTKGYVTPVKNQGQCGSCWSFSATGSLEGQHFKQTGTLNSLSEQQLVDCSKAYGNNGCGGGLMDNAFRYIKDNKGIDLESSYPYEAQDGKCRFNPAYVAATDTGFVDVPQGNEDSLKIAVATVGPISVAIDAGHNSFQLYRGGIYNEPECSSTQLDHGVLAVGYGTQDGSDYWLVKNSWGTSWGNQGYIQMSRNRDNQCGIATMASYPTV